MAGSAVSASPPEQRESHSVHRFLRFRSRVLGVWPGPGIRKATDFARISRVRTGRRHEVFGPLTPNPLVMGRPGISSQNRLADAITPRYGGIRLPFRRLPIQGRQSTRHAGCPTVGVFPARGAIAPGKWDSRTVALVELHLGGKSYDPYRMYQDPAKPIKLEDLALRKEIPPDRLKDRFW